MIVSAISKGDHGATVVEFARALVPEFLRGVLAISEFSLV